MAAAAVYCNETAFPVDYKGEMDNNLTTNTLCVLYIKDDMEWFFGG